MSPRSGVRRPGPPLARLFAALLVALVAAVVAAPAAHAHGFSTVVYADASQPAKDTVRTVLELEYDLLVVSVAENEKAPQFYEDGMDVWGTGEEESALNAHADEVTDYVTKRFTVTADGEACEPERTGDLTASVRQDVPYAVLTLDFACTPASSYEFRSDLFPDEEQYVSGTVTLLQYDLHGRAGNATLDAENPVFDSQEPVLERMGHFFALGAEHLLFGIDHILFLLALIVGSWRLRDIVLAATSFTVAHSVTFILAALGIVSLPSSIVEPAIALSIAVVAIWYLWRVWADRRTPDAGLLRTRKRGFDGADWARLAVVFLFGLLHGMGFAAALGIDEPFSWGLLGSLLIFNVGIEVVQITIILVVFPLLLLLRRHLPRTALAVGVLIGAGVAIMGLVWFVQRVLGIG